MVGDMFEQFHAFLQGQGQEESTIKTNIKLIKRVLADCVPLSRQTIDAFITNLIITKRSPSYIRQYVIVVRLWGRCFTLQDLIDMPYPKKLKNHSCFVRGVMNDNEIEAFINLPFPRQYKDYKDKKYRNSEFQKTRWEMWSIFWLIGAYTGMRPSEVGRLTIQTIEIGEGFFYVLKTKTHTPRKIPISFSIQKTIEGYIKLLQTDLLFPNRYDASVPVSISAFEENFKRRKEILGIKRPHVSAYSLRHSFASRLITESSIYDVKTLMGHKKITTTEKYLHTNEERLKIVVRNDPLSANKKPGKEILLEEYEKASRIAVKQNDKIFTSIEFSEDGTELFIRRKVRDLKSPPPVGYDPPMRVSPHDLLSADDELTT